MSCRDGFLNLPLLFMQLVCQVRFLRIQFFHERLESQWNFVTVHCCISTIHLWMERLTLTRHMTQTANEMVSRSYICTITGLTVLYRAHNLFWAWNTDLLNNIWQKVDDLNCSLKFIHKKYISFTITFHYFYCHCNEQLTWNDWTGIC